MNTNLKKQQKIMKNLLEELDNMESDIYGINSQQSFDKVYLKMKELGTQAIQAGHHLERAGVGVSHTTNEFIGLLDDMIKRNE